MDQFVYAIDIPSVKTRAYFKEMSSRYYKSLVKTIVNGDDDAICSYIDNMISTLMHTGPDVKTLNVIDKLIIMLTVRAYNVSPTIQFTVKNKDDKKINVNVDVNSILAVLQSYKLQSSFQITNTGSINIECTLPKWFYFENYSGLVASCVSTISINNKIVDLCDMSMSERIHVVDQLPSPVFTEISSFLSAQNDHICDRPIFKFDDPDNEIEVGDISISLFNTSCYEFLKMVFNTSLREFYETEYHLCKLKMPWELVTQSTPAELSMIFNIISEDMKKQKAEMDKSDQTGHMVPPK